MNRDNRSAPDTPDLRQAGPSRAHARPRRASLLTAARPRHRASRHCRPAPVTCERPPADGALTSSTTTTYHNTYCVRCKNENHVMNKLTLLECFNIISCSGPYSTTTHTYTHYYCVYICTCLFSVDTSVHT